ncbi:MAG: IS4 family transposase [Candidatus Omnitrophica bacterium]|nr:IS4 family transposase [Candidatus Omnitrophota bacterium]
MRYNSTILRQIIDLIRIRDFQASVSRYRGDWHGREYQSWDNLLTLLSVHIINIKSLRELETVLGVNALKLYHLGMKAHKRSTISDGIRRIDYRIYEKVFYETLERYQKLTADKRKKFRFKNPLKLMDSTVVNIGLGVVDWGRYAKSKGAIKLHYEYDLERDIPEFITITDKDVNDCTIGKNDCRMKPDSIYCFDRGYNDYEWFYSFEDKGAYFITRLKENADYKIIGQHKQISEKDKQKGLLYDLEIKLKGYVKDNRKKLRLVGYVDLETKIEYQFLTNNFELDAYTVTQIYKARWNIEIFFKWIKQNLKIKTFLGTNTNAILSQIWVAMLYFLCLSFVKYQTKYKNTLFYLHKIIKATLFHSRSLLEALSINYIEQKEVQLSLFDP